MQVQELNEKSTTTLVAMYNALSDNPIKEWRKKKSILVTRIIKLQPPEPKPRPGKKETIQNFTCGLLQQVLYYRDVDGKEVEKDDPGAYPVGMSYKNILTAVKKRFPKCKTNYNCLRCYAGRLREGRFEPEFSSFVPVYREPSKWVK